MCFGRGQGVEVTVWINFMIKNDGKGGGAQRRGKGEVMSFLFSGLNVDTKANCLTDGYHFLFCLQQKKVNFIRDIMLSEYYFYGRVGEVSFSGWVNKLRPRSLSLFQHSTSPDFTGTVQRSKSPIPCHARKYSEVKWIKNVPLSIRLLYARVAMNWRRRRKTIARNKKLRKLLFMLDMNGWDGHGITKNEIKTVLGSIQRDKFHDFNELSS